MSAAGAARSARTGPAGRSARDGVRADHAIVVDLGFGDAGKGVVVDLLCAREPVRAVVRFNGGAQAAHNVVTPDGRHHTFAQFGAGTLAPGGPVPTHLSRFMLVEPFALATEADHLARLGVPGALRLLTVDRRALLTTPYHRAANRARETARGGSRHGSCGMGIGETASYALRYGADAPTVGDCADPRTLRRKLRLLADRLRADAENATAGAAEGAEDTGGAGAAESGGAGETADAGRASAPHGFPASADVPEVLDVPDVDDCVEVYGQFARQVRLVDEEYLPGLLAAGPVVFEGAQGVLLDEWHGFHPYTTWSTTTFANAETLLAEAGHGRTARRIGVVRAYTTRHGPGPLVTEDTGLAAALPERHNGDGRWQGAFRVGHFDAVAHRYAVEAAGGVDALAVTHLDSVQRAPVQWCERYRTPEGVWDALPQDPPTDFDLRRRRTDVLLASDPVLGPQPDDPAEAIARALGAPVSITLYGPTRGHAKSPSRTR